LMPQDVVPARKPCGAVTQLSISRKISDNEANLLSERVPVALFARGDYQSWKCRNREPETRGQLYCTMWEEGDTTPKSGHGNQPLKEKL
jgi:hypothetical protein